MRRLALLWFLFDENLVRLQDCGRCKPHPKGRFSQGQGRVAIGLAVELENGVLRVHAILFDCKVLYCPTRELSQPFAVT